MTTISFTFPASVASNLNMNVPGFASASGGGDTVAFQVPAFALPSQVAAGLADAGIQVPPAAGLGAPAAVPDSGVAAGLPQFAPAGLVPQGVALDDPSLAGANAFAQNLAGFGEAATAFFEQAAANPPPADLSELAAWGAAQQQAVLDYFGGM